MPGGRFAPGKPKVKPRSATPKGPVGKLSAAQKRGMSSAEQRVTTRARGASAQASSGGFKLPNISVPSVSFGSGPNVKGGPFPGGKNAIQNALSGVKKRK